MSGKDSKCCKTDRWGTEFEDGWTFCKLEMWTIGVGVVGDCKVTYACSKSSTRSAHRCFCLRKAPRVLVFIYLVYRVRDFDPWVFGLETQCKMVSLDAFFMMDFSAGVIFRGRIIGKSRFTGSIFMTNAEPISPASESPVGLLIAFNATSAWFDGIRGVGIIASTRSWGMTKRVPRSSMKGISLTGILEIGSSWISISSPTPGALLNKDRIPAAYALVVWDRGPGFSITKSYFSTEARRFDMSESTITWVLVTNFCLWGR